jgi:murein DD-endopeptidase MepM/ murein hydrolase activator NlpD
MMRANNFIRAVVSVGFGAMVYFALSVNSTSEASDLQRRVEAHKIILFSKAPKAVQIASEQSEQFVADAPTPSIPPLLAPSSAPTKLEDLSGKVASLAADRQEELQKDALAHAKAAKIAAEKAKKEAERKAKEAAELAKKVAAEKAKKAKQEAERKAKEREAERKLLRLVPVNGGVIGATFGATGMWARYHTGLDFSGVPYGTPVRAVASGKVVYAGNKGNWAGNHVVIKHSDGNQTLYAHLSSITKHSGNVAQGDKIGRVGQSGRAFGSHLHLELYPPGTSPGDVYSAIDPRPWMRRQGVRLG